MFTKTKNLLIVDDDATIRMTLTDLLNQVGYSVRSAEDGFTALSQMRTTMPDIILSDLNMPGMSGFELLSIVRRRFPWIQTVAMSGAFQGNRVPTGVAAHAFYEKATGVDTLLRVLEKQLLYDTKEQMRDDVGHLPIWLPSNGRNPSGQHFVMISCPECLRTFPRAVEMKALLIHDVGCVHCQTPIQYAIVPQSMTQNSSDQS